MFDAGGFTGHKGVDAIAGVVHGGEYVFSAPAVRAIGVPALEEVHRKAKYGHPVMEDLDGFASGGFVPVTAGRSFPTTNNSSSSSRSETNHWRIGVNSGGQMDRAEEERSAARIARSISERQRRRSA
jgi:hypothetical protein